MSSFNLYCCSPNASTAPAAATRSPSVAVGAEESARQRGIAVAYSRALTLADLDGRRAGASPCRQDIALSTGRGHKSPGCSAVAMII